MIFFTPIIVRYLKKNLNILKSRYNKQILEEEACQNESAGLEKRLPN